MSMNAGIKHLAYSAIDTMDEVAATLIEGGLDPRQALRASAILTKDAVDRLMERHFDRRSAAEITHGLHRQTAGNPLRGFLKEDGV